MPAFTAITFTYGEDEPIREDQIEHVYLNEKGEAIKREMGGKNAETEENDVEENMFLEPEKIVFILITNIL